MTNKQINIILDLDETLVSAHGVKDFPFEDKSIREKILQYKIHNMESYYIIFERPHLQEFLAFLFKNFNVSIWSAGSKDYVAYIVKNIILKDDRNIDYLFWSYHCKSSTKKYKNKKSLEMLWDRYKLQGYNANNTILIDDLKETCDPQQNLCINVPEFNVLNKHTDKYLLKLESILKKKLKEARKTS